MLTINTTSLFTNILSWMSFFNLVVNENDFSVPTERHRYLESYVHFKHHAIDTINEKLEHVTVMIIWSGSADIDRQLISVQNYIM